MLSRTITLLSWCLLYHFVLIFLSSSPPMCCTHSFSSVLLLSYLHGFLITPILWPVFSPSFWGQIWEKEQIAASILCSNWKMIVTYSLLKRKFFLCRFVNPSSCFASEMGEEIKEIVFFLIYAIIIPFNIFYLFNLKFFLLKQDKNFSQEREAKLSISSCV